MPSSQSHPLSASQFEATWEKVDATGWRHLEEECQNPSADVADPVYAIDIGDHAMSVSLSCTGKELPFPYNRIIDELDVRAAAFEN